MITHVEIENFRCLKQVSVPLRPLTVLIGPNNSGKSAFLAALYLMQESGRSSTYANSDSWLGDAAIVPQVRLSLSDSTTVSLSPSGVHSLTAARAWMSDINIQSLKPVSLFGRNSIVPSMVSPGLDEAAGVPTIDNEATQLPAYFDRLLRSDRRRFERLVDKLQELLPSFDDILIRTPDSQSRRLDIRWKNGYEAPASEASFGVRLLLFFVGLSFHPTPPKLILIDEPENGIHPKLLKEVVGLLRGLTTGAFGAEPTQVVITTHSPYLLDYISLDTDQVLVASINDDGSRSIEPADQKKLSVFLDEFMLGEVWVNEGETGMVSSK